MASEEVAAEEEHESVFYISHKALVILKIKVEKGEDVPQQLLDQTAYPGDFPEEEMLLPVDLQTLEKDFPEQDLINEDAHLDIKFLVNKLGTQKTAQALLDAKNLFLENRCNVPKEERAQPIVVREWLALCDDAEAGEEGCWEGEEEEKAVDE